MNFCSNCGREITTDMRFCMNCGSRIERKTTPNTEKRTVTYGQVHKCPNCGEVINAFFSKCSSCGYEIRGAQISSSVAEFTRLLSSASTTDQKITIIRSYPIPNTKEDIMEFMLLASTNVLGEQEKTIFDAWLVKYNQSYQKALIVIKDAKDLAGIYILNERTQKQIKVEKKRFRKTAIYEHRKERMIYKQNTLSAKNSPNSGLAMNIFARISSLIVKNATVVAAVIMYIIAVRVDNEGDNSTGWESIAATLIIISASLLYRRKANYVEYIIVAIGAAIIFYLNRFLDNGSMAVLSGALALIITCVHFFRNLTRKKDDIENR